MLGRTLLLAVTLTAACSGLFPGPSPAVGTGALSIDSRGGPAVSVRIGNTEVARVPCDSGAVVRPGVGGVPMLPWDLRIRAVSDGRTVLETRVTELPQWVLLIGNEALISRSAVAGPRGPACT